MNDDADARLYRAMNAPIAREEADFPVSTPEQTMTWSALAWTLTLVAALACVVMVAINWQVR
jgi:hypothetical protein